MTVPPGKLLVEMLNGAGAGAIEIENCFAAVCAEEAESFACNVKVDVPADFGVPLRAPLVALSTRPAGSDPELTLHVYGIVPPDAVIAALYGSCAVALGNDVVMICREDGARLTVIESGSVTACGLELESLISIANEKDPVEEGEPLTSPFETFSEIPGGRLPDATLQ